VNTVQSIIEDDFRSYNSAAYLANVVVAHIKVNQASVQHKGFTPSHPYPILQPLLFFILDLILCVLETLRWLAPKLLLDI
jgi:hypothetical protein